MKYFSKIGNQKTKTSTVTADLTRGVCEARHRLKNCATALLNFSSDAYPWLKSRRFFRYLQYALDFSGGVGIHNDKLYFVSQNKFFYDTYERFEVSEGRKQFFHFNGRILIFPDMLSFDPQTGEHKKFGITTDEITYKIINRTVAGVDCGLSGIVSEDVDLSSYFKIGDGIKITEDEGLGISGYHTVIGRIRESGGLAFKKFEFGDGEEYTLTGRLSHGAPETCDAACISGGRVWVADGNKIYASTINDERNWAVGGDDERSSFECNFDGGDRICACIELDGCPVFFSENRIYKIYGDRASNFSLRCCSDWGGVSKGMSGTVAVVRDKIFYVSRHGVAYFDGNNPKLLERVPFDPSKAVAASSDGKSYYVVVSEVSGATLYVYDEQRGQWYNYGKQDFSGFFSYENALCAANDSKITVLSGSFELMDEQFYATEIIPDVSATFDLDTEGSSPVSLIIDAQSVGALKYDVSVSYDGGEKISVGELDPLISGRVEIPLTPRSCRHIEVSIDGKGIFTLRSLFVRCAV